MEETVQNQMSGNVKPQVVRANNARGSNANVRGNNAGPAAAAVKPNPFQKVTRERGTTLKFQLTPTHVTYANTLRRIMITEVETVAFRTDILESGLTSDVKITENSTPMSNEMLAHRIGLLPIHVAAPLNWDADKYLFKMDIKNEDSKPKDVVASDIIVLENRGADEEPLMVPSVQFFHPDPVTKDTALLTVLKGRVGAQVPESVVFTGKATVGTGRENARFIPVTKCAYGYTIDTNPEKKKELFAKWLTSHKKVSMSELESNEVRRGEMEREFATMEVQRCYMVDERGEPNSFDFIVESVGVLDPVYIVRRALEVLEAKTLHYAAIDSGDLPDTMRVRPADARMKGFDFYFKKEDHTLGNLLATWMEQNLMDSGEVTFVSYKVPHPLRDEMLVRVGVEDGLETTARAALAKAARATGQMFREWLAFWVSAASTGDAQK